MTTPVIALLGCKDVPTDAVEQYCRYLGAALESHDCSTRNSRAFLGGSRLARCYWTPCAGGVLARSLGPRPIHRPRLVVARFSLQLLSRPANLEVRRARIAIVFMMWNLPRPAPRGSPPHSRSTSRHAARLAAADLAILHHSSRKDLLACGLSSRVHFIPVGPNLPFPFRQSRTSAVPATFPHSIIGVFIITGGEPGARERKSFSPLSATPRKTRQAAPLRFRPPRRTPRSRAS